MPDIYKTERERIKIVPFSIIIKPQSCPENKTVNIVPAYGNRVYDDIFLELQAFFEEENFRVVAAIATVTEHLFVHQLTKEGSDEDGRKELSIQKI